MRRATLPCLAAAFYALSLNFSHDYFDIGGLRYSDIAITVWVGALLLASQGVLKRGRASQLLLLVTVLLLGGNIVGWCSTVFTIGNVHNEAFVSALKFGVGVASFWVALLSFCTFPQSYFVALEATVLFSLVPLATGLIHATPGSFYTGFFEDANYFGFSLLVPTTVAWAYAFEPARLTKRVPFVLVAVLGPLMLVRSGSRGAVAAFVASTLVLAVLRGRQLLSRPRLPILPVFQVVLFAGLTLYVGMRLQPWAGRLLADRFGRFLAAPLDTPRLAIWRATWDVFLRYPMGVGYGNTRFVLGRTAGIPMVPHNVFLEALSELGLIGFCGLCALFTAVLFQILARLRHRTILAPHEAAMISSGVGLFVQSLSLNVLNVQHFWLSAAMIVFALYHHGGGKNGRTCGASRRTLLPGR